MQDLGTTAEGAFATAAATTSLSVGWAVGRRLCNVVASNRATVTVAVLLLVTSDILTESNKEQ